MGWGGYLRETVSASSSEQGNNSKTGVNTGDSSKNNNTGSPSIKLCDWNGIMEIVHRELGSSRLFVAMMECALRTVLSAFLTQPTCADFLRAAKELENEI